MFFKNKQQTLETKYDDLISELEDVVVKQYSQYGVKLIKKISMIPLLNFALMLVIANL